MTNQAAVLSCSKKLALFEKTAEEKAPTSPSS